MKKQSLKSFSFSLLVFTFSLYFLPSCADWFQDKVDMNTNANNVSLEDLFHEEEKIDSLKTPAQLFASQGLSAGNISLTWSEVENATSYRIERAVVTSKNASGTYDLPEESDYNLLVKFCYTTNYTDTIITNPQYTNSEYGYHYFYRVSAENYSLSVESEPTNPLSVETRGEGWLLANPSKVEADKGKSATDIRIEWEGIPEASFYKIYRGEKSNGSGMELLDTVYGNQTSYTNYVLSTEQGTEFYYRVAAQNSAGVESAKSSIAMGYSLKAGAPSAPSQVIVENGFGTSKKGFKINWSAVSGSGVSYSLYRSSSEDSVYTLIKNKLSATSFSDETLSLKTGVTYYYFIQTSFTDETSGEVIKSPFSERTDNSFGFLLSPSSSLEVADSDESDKVVLLWSPAVGSEIVNYTYNIYAADSSDGPYELIEANTEGNPAENGLLSLKTSKRNFYRISTYNDASSDEKESVMSLAAAPMPAAPINVEASKTKLLSQKFVPNKNNVYPVLVSWSKPQEDNPAGYIVYRSAKPDSAFRKISGDEPVTELSFIDDNETAKSGNVYYYRVVSVNSLGQGKKGNNPADDLAQADGKNITKVKSLGYGALTTDQWFREFNKTVMNSQKKLTLMHKPNNLDKVGSETIRGDISGTLSYKAAVAGLGAEITMHYEQYADFYSAGNPALGVYFLLTGNTDTTSNMSANGNMHETVRCSGMYPGNAVYDNLQIKGGAAGGGSYGVTTFDLNGSTILTAPVDWKVGEEER